MEALAAELGVADRCRLVGFQKSIRPWYASFDALLLTSANEGTPVVAIEALAAARPVVATRAGGTGTVAKRRQRLPGAIGDTKALADRLAALARDPALRSGWARPAPRTCARASRSAGWRTRSRRSPTTCCGEGPPPAQAAGVSGSGGPPARAAPRAARARRRRPLPRPRRAGNRLPPLLRAPRPARRPAPLRPLRPRPSPRMAWDVHRAIRRSGRPRAHAPRPRRRLWRRCARLLGIPSVSTRHNDDRYLLAVRYVDRACSPVGPKLIAISDAVRAFLERAGHDPAKLVTIRYGLDELPAASSIRRRPRRACRPTRRSPSPSGA